VRTRAARRGLSVAAALAGGLLVGHSDAHAQDATDTCIDSSDRGQVLRDQGSLIAAREAFLACSEESCPEPVRLDCQAWFADADRRLPSIVVRPRDSRGRDLADVRVFDGPRLLAEGANGRAVSIDPGKHELRFERVGAPSVILEFVARETEKARIVDVVIPSDARADARDQSRPSGRAIPTASWVLGGVGLLGIGAFGYLGWTARSDVDEMRRSCAPRCDESRVDDARARALFANVSLGVGVLAIGTATWLALRGNAPEAPERTSRVRLVVEPRASGLAAGVSGSF